MSRDRSFFPFCHKLRLLPVFLPHLQPLLSTSDSGLQLVKGSYRKMPPHPSGLDSLLILCPSPSPCIYFPPGCHWGQHQEGGGWTHRQSHRWLFLRPGCTYPLIPGNPDRKWNAGQVTPSGGPSCPHVASQEGRMRSVVLRRRSLALPSSARLEKPDYWFQARLPSCSLFFFNPSFRLFHFPSSSLLSQHPLYPILT